MTSSIITITFLRSTWQVGYKILSIIEAHFPLHSFQHSFTFRFESYIHISKKLVRYVSPPPRSIIAQSSSPMRSIFKSKYRVKKESPSNHLIITQFPKQETLIPLPLPEKAILTPNSTRTIRSVQHSTNSGPRSPQSWHKTPSHPAQN